MSTWTSRFGVASTMGINDIPQKIVTIRTAQNLLVTGVRLPQSTSDIRFTLLIDSIDLAITWQILKP